MSYMDFSSWPRDQEQSFVVYEQRASESSKKAMTLGVAIASVVLVFMVGVALGVEPKKTDYSKDMNMENLTKKSKRDAPPPAPAPAAAPDPAPAPEAPAAPAAEAPAAEAPAAPAAEETKEE